jgi:hypothetical protein
MHGPDERRRAHAAIPLRCLLVIMLRYRNAPAEPQARRFRRGFSCLLLFGGFL